MKYHFFTLALLNAAAMAKNVFTQQEKIEFMGLAATYGKGYNEVKDVEKALGAFQTNCHVVERMNRNSLGVTYGMN